MHALVCWDAQDSAGVRVASNGLPIETSSAREGGHRGNGLLAALAAAKQAEVRSVKFVSVMW